MLTINSDAATITGNVIITVNARSIRAEVRATDSGVNIKIYAVDLRLIYYLVRFCVSRSVHSITGQLGVSAYTFDDSNRAYASVRVGLRRIRPIFSQTEQGELRRTGATMVEEDVGTAIESKKLKFVLYKYVLENWEDDRKVAPRKVLKETFARQVQTMFDNLQQQQIIPRSIPNVAIFEDRVVDPVVLQGLRPTAEVLASGRLTVAKYNGLVRKTNFSLEGLSLDNLVSSALPFAPEVFTCPPSGSTSVTIIDEEADNLMME